MSSITDRQQSSPIGALFLGLLFVGGGIFMLQYITLNPGKAAEVCIVMAVMAIAVALAIADARILVPYIILLYALMPGVRRVVDWYGGSFTSLSLLSIAAPLANLTLFFPVSHRISAIPPTAMRALRLFAAALLYGSIVGASKGRLSTFYDLVIYGAPLLIIPYAACRRANAAERDVWVKGMIYTALAVSLYGWFQYLTAPPWDVQWMVTGGRACAVGEPEPMKIRVFSTVNSPASAAMLLALAGGAMVAERRWRGVLTVPGVLIVLSGLLITLTRSAWVAMTVLVAAYVALASSGNRLRAVAAVVVIGFFVAVLVPRLPGAEGLIVRASSLTKIAEDDSVNVRIGGIGYFGGEIMKNPIGSGFGATGIGAKLDQGGAVENVVHLDTGILNLFTVFGIPGGLLYLAGVFVLIRAIREAEPALRLPVHSRFALAVMIMFLANMLYFSGFTGVMAALTWLGVSVGLGLPAFSLTAPKPIETPQEPHVPRWKRLEAAERGGPA